MDINLAQALEVIEAAKAKAMEIAHPMVIAVCDSGGNLLALERMDEALLVSVDISINKAYTSVFLKNTTENLGKASQSGGELFGIHNACDNRIVIFGGGIPLQKDGKIVGAIGVSGGSVAQDIIVATAGVERFESLD